MMFIFWELVGRKLAICSSATGFTKPSAGEAAKKAFLTNRIGDFGFMLGILLLFGAECTATSRLPDVADSFKTGSLTRRNATRGHDRRRAAGSSAEPSARARRSRFTSWLPDAMEGPTPVSALIHAATMVAAGVYMLARVSFLIMALRTCRAARHRWLSVASPRSDRRADGHAAERHQAHPRLLHALAARLHGHGRRHWTRARRAMFHLYTHAFFKALLFLGAGAVIYCCHHEQDIWKMGGLEHHRRLRPA